MNNDPTDNSTPDEQPMRINIEVTEEATNTSIEEQPAPVEPDTIGMPEELSADINAVESELDTMPGIPDEEDDTPLSQPVGQPAPEINDAVTPAAAPVAKSTSKKKTFIIAGAAAIGMIIAGIIAGVLLFMAKQESPAPNQSNTNQTQKQAKKLGIAITLHEGTVEFTTDGEAWLPLTDDIQLTEDQKVRTGADSRAVLTLDDGTAIRLDASSQIMIESLDVDNVIITHLEGETYSRVVPSSRSYVVKVDDTLYRALGTAFATVSKPTDKGVRVFQSSVKANGVTEDITEGKQYYKNNSDSSLAGKITDINLDTLVDDDFVKWNLTEDEKSQLFKDKLGVLQQVKQKVEDKTKQTEEEKRMAEEKALKDKQEAERKAKEEAERKKKEKEANNGEKVKRGAISASKSGNKITWSYTGKATYGYKMVYSEHTANPVFGSDDAIYYSDPTSSWAELPKSAKKDTPYNVRICAYTNGTESEPCVDYSNTIQLTR